MQDLTPADALACDPQLAAAIRRAIDGKTKPLGALGRIEDLAARIAALQGTTGPVVETCELILFAGDHGIAAQGVSAFPQAVTAQMALNFLAGGAAANVFARATGVDLKVVDAGIAEAIDHPDLIDRRMGPGTADCSRGPAMTAETLAKALAAGRALAEAADAHALAFGEMGIANTASASLVIHKLSGLSLALLTGRGTGLDDAGLTRKLAVLERAAARTGELTAEQALAEYGGFEIAMMAGAMIGAAGLRKVVLVDGFIATAAAMAARALEPGCEPAFVYCHRSAELGHRAALDHLGGQALLELDLRLGEGTGALLAWPLVKSAAAMLREMASFESAGVSGKL